MQGRKFQCEFPVVAHPLLGHRQKYAYLQSQREDRLDTSSQECGPPVASAASLCSSCSCQTAKFSSATVVEQSESRKHGCCIRQLVCMPCAVPSGGRSCCTLVLVAAMRPSLHSMHAPHLLGCQVMDASLPDLSAAGHWQMYLEHDVGYHELVMPANHCSLSADACYAIAACTAHAKCCKSQHLFVSNNKPCQ
jgi:hypothetical protein